MPDPVITEVRGAFSEEHAAQLRELLSSNRPFSEIESEMTRIVKEAEKDNGDLGPLPPDAQARRHVVCRGCNCATSTRTCDEFVMTRTGWTFVGTSVRECGLFERIRKCGADVRRAIRRIRGSLRD